MRIYLDRASCDVWIGACETCFSWHYLGEEIIPNFCLLKIEDDGRSERTFVIQDRDGVEKVLEVSLENWPEVHDSWFLAWKDQQEQHQVEANSL